MAVTDTGWLSCGTGSSTGSGDGNWASTSNITADDGSEASVSLGKNDDSNTLIASNFGANVGGTIIGIEVRIQRRASGSNDINYNKIRLYNGSSEVGDNKALSGKWGTSEATDTVGGSSDLWAASLTPAQINSSDFGVRIITQHDSSNNTRTSYIDFVEVKIYYDAAIDISANTDNLTLTTYAADVSDGFIPVNANTDALTLTEYPATVSDGWFRVYPETVDLILTEYAATIGFDTGTIVGDTGWVAASSAGETGSVWSGETNIYSDDTSYASTTESLASQTESAYYLYGSNFGLSVPTGATITGVETRIIGYADMTSLNGASGYVYIQDGTSWSSTSYFVDQTSFYSDQTHDNGGSSDLWGLSLTPALVNSSNFKVGFRSYNKSSYGAGNSKIQIDQVLVKVHYAYEKPEGQVDCRPPHDLKLIAHGADIDGTPTTVIDSGWHYPSVASAIGSSVSNLANVEGDDGQYATSVSRDIFSTLNATTVTFDEFGFSIPNNSIITGIQYNVTGKNSSGGTVENLDMYIVGNSITSANKVELAAEGWNSTSDTSHTYGGENDTLGGVDTDYDDVKDRNWASADINHNDFGIYIDIFADTDFTAQFDNVAIRVWYIEPPPIVIEANTATLTLTEYAATVELKTGETITIDSAASVTLTTNDVNINAATTIPVDASSITITALDANINAAEVITTDTASITLNALDANVDAATTIAVDTAVITLAALDVNINQAEGISVDVASVSITSLDVNINAEEYITTDTASITITALDANVDAATTIAVDTASITLATNDVKVNETLPVAVVDITISALDVNINAEDYITTDAASITISGLDVVVNAADTITIDTTSITLTTFDANVNAAEVLPVDTASITITAYDVGLLEGEVVDVDTASITITGLDVAVIADEAVSIDTASITITGQDANVNASETIAIGTSVITITALNTTVIADYVIGVNTATVAVSGLDVAVIADEAVPVDVASIAISGLDVVVNEGEIVFTDTASITLTALDINLNEGEVLFVDTTSITLTAYDINLNEGEIIFVDTGAITINGLDVAVIANEVIFIDTTAITINTPNLTVRVSRSSFTIECYTEAYVDGQLTSALVDSIEITQTQLNTSITEQHNTFTLDEDENALSLTNNENTIMIG